MKDFIYYTPTEVVFGVDAENHIASLVVKNKGSKVLIHYGGHSAERSGLLDEVRRQLDSAGINHISLGGVVPNPRLGKVYEGINLCHKEGVDFILAIGGGSDIDSAKAIAYEIAYYGDVWDFFIGKAGATDSCPLCVMLTIPAVGSEMSNECVITREKGELKT